MFAASKIASGFKLRVWIDRLLIGIFIEGRTSGIIFTDTDGRLITSTVMNNSLLLKSSRLRQ